MLVVFEVFFQIYANFGNDFSLPSNSFKAEICT